MSKKSDDHTPKHGKKAPKGPHQAAQDEIAARGESILKKLLGSRTKGVNPSGGGTHRKS